MSEEETAEGDALLMHRVAEGDLKALGEIYMRYGSLVRSVAYNHLAAGSTHDAEDVCQRVFMALIDLAPRYRDEGKLRAVLCRTAIQMVWAGRRKERLRRTLTGGLFERRGSSTEGTQGGVDAQRDLDRALSRLPDDQRDVLLLHTLESLSGEEIAAALGIKLNTVWTRLHRARAKLQELLSSDEEQQ